MSGELDELVISPKNPDGKGRAFRALRVATVMADAFLKLGAGDKHDRPIYASFAASDGEVRAFVANLLLGRPAVPASGTYRRRGADSGYEFMKSVGYKVIYQRHEEGTVATVYLPDLVDRDPGMVDPEGVKFVVLPGAAYLAREAERMPVEEVVAYARRLPAVEAANEPEKDWRGHLREGWEEPLSLEVLAGMVPLAYLFALYLSNRSRAPIPPDGRFYLQLLLGCLKRGLASWSEPRGRFGRNEAYKFVEEGADRGGLAPGVAFMADHKEVEAALAAECETYFLRTEGE